MKKNVYFKIGDVFDEIPHRNIDQSQSPLLKIRSHRMWKFFRILKIKFNQSDESRIHRIHQKVRTWTSRFKSNFSKQSK